jgi:hypothetical protein
MRHVCSRVGFFAPPPACRGRCWERVMLLIFGSEVRPHPNPPLRAGGARLWSLRVLRDGHHQESRARFLCVEATSAARGIVHPIHGVHPYALRASGPACGCPNSFQTNSSNPEGPRPSLSASKTKRPTRGRFVLLAEREGFEPSVVLPLRLISSQVHSTTLPPLQRGARGPREPASLRGRRNGDKHTERWACLLGDRISRLFSSPAAARYRPRCPGSATAIRSPVPSAIRPDPDGHWDPGRKCRCICPWHERS